MADPRISLDPGGVDLRLHPGAQKRSHSSLVGTSALGLDTSRISQVSGVSNQSRGSIGSRDSSSSGTVTLGGISYPIGGTVGSSGLFVIGDPAGESSRPSSRVSNQSYQTGTSNRSSAGLLPYNTGYGFETWNWLWIHYILTVTAFTAAIVFLSVAIGLIVHENRVCKLSLEWWQGVTIYHLKVPEFSKLGGGGNLIGNIAGISARINYFEEMTVSVVCLSNFLTMHYAGWIYPTNFENVDSRLGTLQDFQQMVQKLHDNNIKVILSWNPVEAHVEHSWFEKSRLGQSINGDAYSKAFVWASSPLDGGTSEMHNEWGSWTRDEVRNQYYYHRNNSDLPVLNWQSADTQQLIEDAMRHWLDLGVDGFYVDNMFDFFVTTIDSTVFIMNRWRNLLDSYTKRTGQYRILATSEAQMNDVRHNNYNALKRTLLNVDLIEVDFTMDMEDPRVTFKDTVERGMSWQSGIPSRPADGSDYSLSWESSDHDHPWISWSIHALGGFTLEELLAVEIALFMLPGSVSLYAGQEIGRDPTLGSADASGFNPIDWENDLEAYWIDERVTGFKGKELVQKMSKRHTEDATLRMAEGDSSQDGLEYLPCEPEFCIFFRREYKLQDVYYYIVNFNSKVIEDNFSEYGLSVPVVVDTSDDGNSKLYLKKLEIDTNQTIVFTVWR